jgi:hypothetical protein
MTVVPFPGTPPEPDARWYVWLVVPGTSGTSATFTEANTAVFDAMTEHPDAQAAAIYAARLTHEWPYIKLWRETGYTRQYLDQLMTAITRNVVARIRLTPVQAPPGTDRERPS